MTDLELDCSQHFKQFSLVKVVSVQKLKIRLLDSVIFVCLSLVYSISILVILAFFQILKEF